MNMEETFYSDSSMNSLCDTAWYDFDIDDYSNHQKPDPQFVFESTYDDYLRLVA